MAIETQRAMAPDTLAWPGDASAATPSDSLVIVEDNPPDEFGPAQIDGLISLAIGQLERLDSPLASAA